MVNVGKYISPMDPMGYTHIPPTEVTVGGRWCLEETPKGNGRFYSTPILRTKDP